MAKSSRTPAAFVTGIAWILIIVAGWATLRLTYMLTITIQVDDSSKMSWIILPKIVKESLMIIHLVVAAFSIYAGSMMLRMKRWTRIYFATVLASIGLEAVMFSTILVLDDQSAAAKNGLQGLMLVSAGAVFFMGVTSILLAWKLLRDRGIREALVG